MITKGANQGVGVYQNGSAAFQKKVAYPFHRLEQDWIAGRPSNRAVELNIKICKILAMLRILLHLMNDIFNLDQLLVGGTLCCKRRQLRLAKAAGFAPSHD